MNKLSNFLVLSLFAFGTSYAAAQASYTIRFSHVQKPETIKGQAAEKFKDLVQEYTNGKVNVEVYHDSSLFNDRASVKALTDNQVEMIAPGTSQMDIFYKDKTKNPWAIFDIPYLVKNEKDVQAIKSLFNDFNKEDPSNNLLILDMWANGFKDLSSNFPLKNPEDLQKMKPRAQTSDVVKRQYVSWGTYPRVSDYNSMFTMMSYGLANGSDNTATNFYNSNLHQVQPYYYQSQHAYYGYLVGIRRNFWEGLPKDIQTSILKALKEATLFADAQSKIENDVAIEKVIGSGLTRVAPLPDNIAAFIKQKNAYIIKGLSPEQLHAYQQAEQVLAK